MRLDLTAEPITDDDETIRAAVEAADPAALLVAVAQLTGEHELLADDLRPDAAMVLSPDAGLGPERVARIRDLAAAALCRHRDAGSPEAPPPDDDALRRMIGFLVGDAIDDYLPLLREELLVDGRDLRAPGWTVGDVAPGRTFRVAVVGAGMSGLAATHRLVQAGAEVVVFEKNADVGGTWFENTYPGCRVDVPNHLYSYSFAQTRDWPQYFSSQDVLLDYFRTVADELDLRRHVRFSTEVVEAVFDEGDQTWAVRVRTPEGVDELHTVDAVVSAVGQLNRPRWPDIPGADRFGGPCFHSARWDHSVDLAGKRVGIIGTGASAAQFIPAVADEAAETTVFMRTAPWLAPTPNYTDELPGGVQWVLRHVPAYARWDRLWLFWRTHEGLLPMAKVDPAWEGGERSVSAANDMVRMMLTAYITGDVADAELAEKLVPDYPPIAKRIIRDNGIWTRTFQRDDVTLCTERIEEITEKGVRTADGTEHLFDVLVYGTGFTASEFLVPMAVKGVGGADLHEQWAGDARAYLGITVPGFPNLFLLYGPNTNIVINGSIIYFTECEVHYVVECLRLLLEGGHRSLEVRPEVHDAYNERIDAENRAMAWGASQVSSWYKNAKGRVAQNWPFSLLEYWRQTRVPDPADYVLR